MSIVRLSSRAIFLVSILGIYAPSRALDLILAIFGYPLCRRMMERYDIVEQELQFLVQGVEGRTIYIS
jgi:hypothetical protein